MTEDMGPLPKGDRQDSLQQLSLTALRNLLPQDRFLIRDERADDKGVDVSLEAKIAKTADKEQFTNCRAQAQLKSTDSIKQNQDGSVSHPLDVSNLNYLLNGPCPIYFLWIEPAKQMRYAWRGRSGGGWMLRTRRGKRRTRSRCGFAKCLTRTPSTNGSLPRRGSRGNPRDAGKGLAGQARRRQHQS